MTPQNPLPLWTCPYCPLACDDLGVAVDPADGRLRLHGGECPRAEAALGRVGAPHAAPRATVDGVPADADHAIAVAAARLAASAQPLFAGLGTDVAGARALYPLVCATGGIVDVAGGDAFIQGVRALQDRGQYTTTLAEIRTRADLVVFVGGVPFAAAPRLGPRLGLGAASAQAPRREVVVLGAPHGGDAGPDGWAGPGVTVESVAPSAELFDLLSRLAIDVARPGTPATPDRRPAGVQEEIAALAARLHAARYAVLVGSPASWPVPPAHAALAIEAVHRIVDALNRRSRAAALWIGGADGAATVNQVFAWLSGLPVRSRVGPHGLEHDPLRHGAAHVLAGGAADLLVWVSSFDAATDHLPPAEPHLPRIVLGPPSLGPAVARPGTVFVAVGTPGIGHAGHAFRTDGTVLMPLHAVRDDGLPPVADVAARLLQALPAPPPRGAGPPGRGATP